MTQRPHLGLRDFSAGRPGKAAAISATTSARSFGVGHHAQAYGTDAEIADRGAQALLDRPVAVGRRRL